MPDLDLEQAHRIAGCRVICGVDEAGRGPWAGPVVAGAAIINEASLSPELGNAIDDSKKLSGLRRETLYRQFDGAIQTGVGLANVDEIDQLNILQATLLAMKRAVEDLGVSVDMALIDGNRAPELGPTPTDCIVKGDARSLSIAAASIVAKVTRDRIMTELSGRYPGYGWERNSGYGTAEHQAALNRLGVTPEHRKSFAPIRKILGS
jgi:ribonuclease HII